ncbi:MAG: DUF503 domain-containing protein [Acidobacteria bacterium]|nr:DUF503 domain-containing protein [Acidobacteriota bacterium]
MTVGVCTIELFIPAARSLKDKRQVVKSVVARLRNRHNVSIAEVGHQDLWQRAAIAIAAVASSQKPLDATFQTILNEIEASLPGHIVSHDIQFL